MKRTAFLLLLCIGLPCLKGNAQPAPPVEATTTQVGAGTLGYPFVVTPRGLLGFGPVYTNLAASTVTNIAASTTNAFMGYIGTPTNLVLLSGSNGPPVVGQALVIIGTNASGALVAKSTNWPAGGGGGITLSDATNVTLAVGPVALAGANISVSRAQNSNGGTNETVALLDPASLGQVNVGTAWLTNTVLPTNALVSMVADMSKSFSVTNTSGNIAFTDVANVTSGAYNSCIIRIFASGADKTVTFPASWHTNYAFNPVITNGWQQDLMVTVTGARTNVTQVIYP